MIKKVLAKIFDFFTSMKLAVILILSLGIMLAVGTFYEADHGTAAAQRVIYKSWFVSLEMLLLIINLSCSAISRLPWKKHHVGFVITHMGIITLLVGSFITQKKGIDGNLAMGINESTDSFTLPDTELSAFQMLDGRPFAILLQKPVDFDRHPPEKKDYQFKLADDDVLKVDHYIEKGLRQIEVRSSADATKLPAVKFTLYNDRVHVSEWLGLDKQIPPFYDLGPASVSFIQGNLPKLPQPKNQIVIYQPEAKEPILKYAIYSVRQLAPVQEGVIEPKKEYNTGWMNIKFLVEEFYPHSEPVIDYTKAEESAVQNGTQVVQVSIGENKKWFELEAPHEIKGKNSSYFVSFSRQRHELGFVMSLKKFKVGTYGGSSLPATYQSTVSIDSKREQVISMNEPLKFKELTIYQSSFETNDSGEPLVSVFSINYDPGRPVKYAGALSIVGGIGIMFYWKPRYTRKGAKQANQEDEV